MDYETRSRTNNATVVVVLLICVLVPLYTSVEISLFIVDQYVYYRYSTDVGLPYGPKDDKNSCINGTTDEAHDSDHKKRVWVQEQTAYVTSVNNFLGMATGTLATLVMGYVSDRLGRRFVLLWIMLSEALRLSSGSLIMMFNLNPWTMVIPNLFEGLLCGGLLSAIAQISVCAVDLTKPHQECSTSPDDRNRFQQKCWLLLTLFDASASICLAVGKALGGFLVYHHGFPMTAMINLILFAPGVIAVYFLPETNPYLLAGSNANNTSPSQFTVHRELQTTAISDKIRRTVWFWCSELKDMLYRTVHAASVMTIVILFLFSIAAMVDIHYGFLYLMGPPFCWNPSEVGFYSGLADSFSAVVSMIFVIFAVRFGLRLKRSRIPDEVFCDRSELDDQRPCILPDSTRTDQMTGHQKLLVLLLFIGLALLVVSKIITGVAYLFHLPAANIIIYVAMAFKITKSINIPVIRALLASWLPNNQQGRIFALAALSERIGLLISVSTLPLMYAATVTTCPGTVFLFCAALLAIGLILTGLLPLVSSKLPRPRANHDGDTLVCSEMD